VYIGGGGTLPALEERSQAQQEEKRAIARVAAARICDGDSVLLDGGTTTLEVARLLVGRSVQIVTNSLPIAAVRQPGGRPGPSGRLRLSEDGRRTRSAVGPHDGRPASSKRSSASAG
jgi:hypothetical protein